jgi:putative transposase
LRPRIDPGHAELSTRRQCRRVGRSRATFYWAPAEESAEHLRLMRLIDEQYTACPFYGSRRLARNGHAVNRKRVRRLLRLMGLEAIHPKPKLSAAGRGHQVYPYRLRDVSIDRVRQVWSADITYLPMASGFMSLAATIDWYRRYVVARRPSNTRDGAFCRDMLDEALAAGTPEVFNTDPGVPFTAGAWVGRVEAAGVRVRMGGRGRCLDNVFVERLWRTVKYEDVFLRGYESVPELERGLKAYFAFYNEARLHQSLGYKTPAEVYRAGRSKESAKV